MHKYIRKVLNTNSTCSTLFIDRGNICFKTALKQICYGKIYTNVMWSDIKDHTYNKY